jgi:transcriptional regulator with XRE-family HTH domain
LKLVCQGLLGNFFGKFEKNVAFRTRVCYNKNTNKAVNIMENDLSRKIKELRLAKKMTLEQVADIVGVGKSTVRKWETGMIANMKRDKIALLAKALSTTPAHLMGWKEDEKLQPKEVALAEYEDILLKALRRVPEDKREAVTHAIQTVLDAYK